jgi:hypothetical protein
MKETQVKTETLDKLTWDDLEILEFGVAAWLMIAHGKPEFSSSPPESKIMRGENLQKRLRLLLMKIL